MSVSQNVQVAFADTAGNVQSLNGGFSDNSSAIFYELETQDLEFGNRAHTKQISDKMGVIGSFDSKSELYAKQDGLLTPSQIPLTGRVNVGDRFNLIGHFFSLLWRGSTTTWQPTFEGLSIENVTDLGLIE